MLDGITVLNSFEVVSKTVFNWNGFWIGAIVGVFVCLIVCFIASSDIKEFLITFSIAFIFIGSLVGFFFGGAVMDKPKEYEARWEVTIEDSVSMNEFYNQYEVVEQRGEIYVIKEKENEHDN